MSGRTGLRGRRTRVYDCNYNMGESYYRPAIDRLDRKYSGRPETIEEAPLIRELPRDILDRHDRAFENDDLSSARSRASKVISEESLFDSRGGRTARGRPISSAFDDSTDIDEEVAQSLRRIRAIKQTSAIDDGDEITTVQRRPRLDLSDKILDSVGLGSSEVSEKSATLRRRVLKVTSSDESENTGGLTKWSALKSNDEDHSSAAAIRARQSRALLNDIENEMTENSERQAAREKRIANLRALMAENDEQNSNIQTALKSSKISSLRAEKKIVSF